MIPEMFLQGVFLSLFIFAVFEIWQMCKYFLIGVIFIMYLIDKKKITKKVHMVN